MRTVGFNAYCVYLYIKNIHFKDNSYDIMSLREIPLKDKLLSSWNNKRRKKDGQKFKAIEEVCSDIKSLALLFSSYYVQDNNFYIQDIFEDDFEIYKKNVSELKLLKEVFINDLKEIITICKEDQIKPLDLLTSKTEIPRIFKIGISINSLVILNKLFKIVELNKNICINSLEKEKWKDITLNLRWYKEIIKSYIKQYDWKTIVKKVLNK